MKNRVWWTQQAASLLFIIFILTVFPVMAQESTQEAEATATEETQASVQDGVFIFGIPDNAADNDPDTPDFLMSGDLNFPVDMSFSAAIGLTEPELAGMTLRIRYLSQRAETIVNFPADVPYSFSGEFVRADYVVELTEENAPLLFEEVTFAWQVTDIKGTTYEDSDSFIFQDERVGWQRSSTPDDSTPTADRLELVIPETVTDINLAREDRNARRIYERLVEETGTTLALKYLYYPPSLPFACEIGEEGEPAIRKFVDGEIIELPCDLALTRAIYARSGYVVIEGADFEIPYDAWVARFYAPLWDGADVPDWFVAGLTRLYTGDSRQTYSVSRQVLRTDEALSLAAMQTQPDSSDTDVLTKWEAQSYGMLVYTARLTGVDAIFELARSLADYPTFEAAYEDITGQTLSRLIPMWETWIFSEQAASDYVYRIYYLTTATPTLTPTVTPTRIPSTATYTPTATHTPRPPTFTPRPTDIPPTVTPTLLPAGSFVLRATAVPEANNAAGNPLANPGQTETPVLIGAGIVALLILIGGIIWARRG